MKLRVDFFIQDNCPICEQIKDEFKLKTVSKSFIQDVPVNKIYVSQENIKKYNLTRVPTMCIISFSEEHPQIEIVDYTETGFIPVTTLVKYLEILKSGKELTTRLKSNTTGLEI